VSAILVAVPIFFGLRLETAIQDRMLDAWRGTSRPPTSLTRLLDGVEVFRTTAWYRKLLRIIKYQLAPIFFAVLTVYIAVAFLSHFAFYLEDAGGMTCHPSANAKPLQSSQRTPALAFDPKSECWPSGIKLSKGVRYVISVKISDDWADNHYHADVRGLTITRLPTWWDRAAMIVAVPFRRILLRPWYRIIARVGETGTDEYFLDPDVGDRKSLDIPFTANRDGELYLYVNDMVLPIFMDYFYRSNRGTATATSRTTGTAGSTIAPGPAAATLVDGTYAAYVGGVRETPGRSRIPRILHGRIIVGGDAVSDIPIAELARVGIANVDIVPRPFAVRAWIRIEVAWRRTTERSVIVSHLRKCADLLGDGTAVEKAERCNDHVIVRLIRRALQLVRLRMRKADDRHHRNGRDPDIAGLLGIRLILGGG
jgi:hypothetical protein